MSDQRDTVAGLRRTVAQHARQMAEMPVRIASGGRGADGASGTFVCELLGNVAGGTIAAMTSTTATVYSLGQAGAETELGTRTVLNPFATVGLIGQRFTCAKTWDDPEDEADDEFTLLHDGGAIIVKAASGIAGRSGDTPGSATCDVFKWAGDALADSTLNVTVYNLAAEAVAEDVYLQAKVVGGRYVVDWEECP